MAVKAERIPGNRLITQNMLSSASLYERKKAIPWPAIQDLSTLIDILCLYDKAIVLGAMGHYVLSWKSEFMEYLKDSHFIGTEEYYSDREKEIIAKSASGHLMAFLGENDSGKFAELLDYALRPESTEKLDDMPDSDYEIDIGEEWLKTVPTRKQLLNQLQKEQEYLKGTTFLLRTFVYYAYANVNKIAFTPDAVRVPVLTKILKDEEQFRGRLLKTLDIGYQQRPGDSDLLQRTSPFSAIVFSRAYPHKKNIIREIDRLRNELKPIRERLRSIENDLLWTEGTHVIEANQKWNRILNEVEKNFGLEPQLIQIKTGLNFAQDLGNIIENPTSPKSWAGALLKLPTEAVIRFLNQRPVIELHHLNTKLPGTSRLENSINRLFELA